MPSLPLATRTRAPGLVEHDGGNADEHPRPLREVAALVTLPEMLWVVRIGTPPFAPDYQDYIATERTPLRGQTLFRVVDWGPDSWMAQRIKVVWNGEREPVIHHLG